MKPRRVYVCESCGHTTPKWLGRCPGCSAWSSLVEEVAPRGKPQRPGAHLGVSTTPPQSLAAISTDDSARAHTGIAELDRVLGGGLVPGALVLVGGDPGIGKSTLLLQAAACIANKEGKTLYITAEESAQQVKMRASRLKLPADNVFLWAQTSLDTLEDVLKELKPALLIVDSIQTVGIESLESPIGSVSQIRGVTHKLMHIAKASGVTTFVVGHVTKDGAIAGPKVMEHMVDTVLYFEGERTGPYRILRAHKNRFGSAQEIGVFEMHSEGLRAVSNPSELFLSQRAHGPGSAVVTSLEGSRPLLLEVQALTSPALYGTPRRTSIGFDPQRVAMLCAVLERHAGVTLAGADVYVNVAGGVRVQEPAADLGVLMALVSAATGIAVPEDTVVMGEVGLAGEMRAVAQLASRVHEAESLGFARAIVPQVDLDRWRGDLPTLPLHGVRNVHEALTETGLLEQSKP